MQKRWTYKWILAQMQNRWTYKWSSNGSNPPMVSAWIPIVDQEFSGIPQHLHWRIWSLILVGRIHKPIRLNGICTAMRKKGRYKLISIIWVLFNQINYSNVSIVSDEVIFLILKWQIHTCHFDNYPTIKRVQTNFVGGVNPIKLLLSDHWTSSWGFLPMIYKCQQWGSCPDGHFSVYNLLYCWNGIGFFFSAIETSAF